MKGSGCFSKLINYFFKLFEKKDCILYIPTICFWEISRKVITRKLVIRNKSPEESLLIIQKPMDTLENLREIPLTRQAASIAPTFSSKLPDPFDQLIVASALDANLPLITKDINIQKSKLIQVVW